MTRNLLPQTRKIAGFLLTIVIAITMMPMEASAWGDEGHKITALVAFQLLNPRAKANVLMVLEGEPMTDVSVWPDELKRAGQGCVIPGSAHCNPNYRPETAQWHFVDMPLSGNGHFSLNDPYCKRSVYGDCIVPAIEDFRDILRKSTSRPFGGKNDETKRKLHDALSFIVHFLGDIHQPLHCADNDDAGGNNVLVTWQNEPKYEWENIWNLHSVWDTYLVSRNIMSLPPAQQTYAKYADFLFNNLSQQERQYAQLKAATINPGSPENVIAWAEGSFALARSTAYNLPGTKVKKSTRGFEKIVNSQPQDIVVLNENYFKAGMPVVAKELRLGGVRLARILNEIYDKDIH